MDEIGNNFLFLVVAHKHFVQIDIHGWLNQRTNLLVIMMTSSNGKHFPRYLPSVPGIHRSPMNYPHKGQWRWALMFSLICAWTNGWLSSRDAGDLRRHCAHYDVTVMTSSCDIRWQRLSVLWQPMMTPSSGNIFRVTGHLCGEFTGPRWIPRTKASDAELWCSLWSASE